MPGMNRERFHANFPPIFHNQRNLGSALIGCQSFHEMRNSLQSLRGEQSISALISFGRATLCGAGWLDGVSPYRETQSIFQCAKLY
jgi:hypothetical protein